MIVTFCGHSELHACNGLEDWLYDVIEASIQEGAHIFYLGGYGAFDLLAARIVTQLKKKYPYIERTFVTPYLNREMNKALYDNSYYPNLETVPKRLAILRRNEKMIEEASIVIAFVQYSWGGAAKTLAYAQRKKKVIIQYETPL